MDRTRVDNWHKPEKNYERRKNVTIFRMLAHTRAAFGCLFRGAGFATCASQVWGAKYI
jgi:hypothetical protein